MAGALGEAVVEILADIDHFDEDVRRRLAASADAAAENVQRQMDRVSRSAAQAGRNLADALGDGAGRASTQIERMTRLADQANHAFENLDAEGLARVSAEAQRAQRDFNELARAARAAEGQFAGMDADQLDRIARQAETAALNVAEVGQRAREANNVLTQFRGAELENLARQAQLAADRLDRLSRTPLRRIRGEAGEAGRAILAAFRGSSEGAEDALSRIDNQRFNKLVRSAVGAALKIRAAFKTLAKNVDLEDSVLRSGRAFRTLLLVAGGIGAIAIKLSAAASAASGFIAALAPGVGILAAIPSAIALFTAASSTLKVALLGVGDAVKAAFGSDAKAFEESLKKLAPAAQKTAREFRSLKPQIDALRKSVQGAFFKPLEGQIKATGKALIGPLKKGMTGTAAEFGRLGRAVLAFGKSGAAVNLVKSTFAQLKTQIGGIKSGTITNLLASVSKFTTSVFPAFNGLGGGIDSVLRRLTAFLSTAAEGGDALRWVRQALEVFAQLGRIISNVGSLFAGVYNAIRASGGGALTTIENLTAGLAEFARSAEGQADLGVIFSTIATIGAQALPVIKALVSGLGELAPVIAELALRTGPILTDAIGAVVPALKGLGVGLISVFDAARKAVSGLKDSGALGEFGRAAGALLAAVSPLITALGTVLVSAFRAVAIAARILAPIFSVVAKAISAIARSPIGIFLGVLVAQLVLVRLVTGSWTVALKSLIPVLKLAGKAVLALGRALLAAIVANPIVAAIAAVVLVLGFLLTRLEPVRRALSRLRDMAGAAFDRLKAFGAGLLNTFKTEGPLAALRELGRGIVTLVQTGADKLAQYGPKILEALLSGFRSALAALPGILQRFGALVTAGITRAVQSIPTIIKFYVAALIAEFRFIGAALPAIVGGLKTALVGAFGALRTEGPKIAATIRDLVVQGFSFLETQGPVILRNAFQFLRNAGATLLTFAASAIRTATAGIVANLPGIATKIAGVLTKIIGQVGQAIPAVLNGLSSALSGGLDSAVGQAAAGTRGGAGGEKLKTSLSTLLLDVLSAVGAAIPQLIPVIVKAVAQIQLAILQALIAAAPGILSAVAGLLLAAAGALLSSLGSFLLSLPAKIASLAITLVGAMLVLGQQAMFALLRAIVTGVGTVIGFVVSIPILIVAALGRLVIELFNLGKRAVTALRNAFAPANEDIPTILKRLPGRVVAALISLGPKLKTLGKNALSALGNAVGSGISKVTTFFSNLNDKVISTVGKLGGQLKSIGGQLMRGFIDGVKSVGSALVDAVLAPINSAISKAKSLLHIGSPSKVFHAIGSDTMQGFINGTSEKAKKAAAVFRRLIADVVAITGRGFVKGLTGTSSKITSTIDKTVRAITKAFKGKKTNIDNVLVAQLDATNKRLQALVKKRTKLADQVKAATEFANNVTASARQFGGITNVTADEAGNITGADVDTQLKARLKSIEAFQRDLNSLSKKGLNKSSIEQIVGQGVDQGGALATALAKSSNTTINSINNTTKQINAASANLGKSTADLLFDSGKSAGKGFLDGLKSQQAEIEKLMVTIAKSAANAIRKTLKIKSPSKVMESLGGFTIQGFLAGIEALAPEIGKALESAVRIRNAVARQLEASTTAGAVNSSVAASAPTAPTAPATTADAVAALVAALDRLAARNGGTAGAAGTTVNAPITVNLPTADPEAVAQVVGRRVASIANR